MIAVIAWIGGGAGGWLIIAALLALGIGRGVRIADRREARR